MQIVGIICEYNPFHNGHLYHLKKVKELFPDSLVILVLNGYFLERGEVSILSKENKCQIALTMGIDIVMEIPFVYGTQSADTFANISLQILNELKCEYLVFGSESNDLDALNKISDYTYRESENYQKDVKKYLSMGYNYPSSLAKALNIDFTFMPNDLLGISYLKAIKKNNYQIKPVIIKRTNNYLDTSSNEDIVSATNIRHKMENKEDITKFVPKMVLNKIEYISLNDFFPYLKYKILTEKDLSIYVDVEEGIHNRIKKVINDCHNIDELIDKLKSKRYTYNKIRRMLIHILIGFTKGDHQNLEFDYLKVLGFNERGKIYLNKIKSNLNIPLSINKKSLVYKYELTAAAIYDLISQRKCLEYEMNSKPLFLIVNKK